MAGLWGRAPEFDQAVEGFKCFVRRLEQYFIACDVPDSDAVKKRAILLSVLRPQCYGLLEDLVSPKKPSDCKYANLVEVLSNHFEPEESVIVERFRFHSCCRADGESVAEFLARLRCLAKRCSFPSGTLEDNLRDRFVCGIGDRRLQTRLLSQSDLTLASAVSTARAFESAETQAREIARGSGPSSAAAKVVATESAVGGEGHVLRDVTPPAEVGRVEQQGRRAGREGRNPAPRGRGRGAGQPGGTGGGAPRRSRQRETADQLRAPCDRCRSRRHSPSRCWARSRRCFLCGEIGHVRDACRSGRLDLVEEDEFGAEPEPPERDSEGDEVYQLFYETADAVRRNRRPPLYVDVKLNGRAIRTELDTGAAVSVCSESEFFKLWPKGQGGPVMKPSGLKLQTYGGDGLTVLGEVLVCVQYGSVSVNLPLVIVKGDGPCLFGRDWLSHFRLDWATFAGYQGWRQIHS